MKPKMQVFSVIFMTVAVIVIAFVIHQNNLPKTITINEEKVAFDAKLVDEITFYQKNTPNFAANEESDYDVSVTYKSIKFDYKIYQRDTYYLIHITKNDKDSFYAQTNDVKTLSQLLSNYKTK